MILIYIFLLGPGILSIPKNFYAFFLFAVMASLALAFLLKIINPDWVIRYANEQTKHLDNYITGFFSVFLLGSLIMLLKHNHNMEQEELTKSKLQLEEKQHEI